MTGRRNMAFRSRQANTCHDCGACVTGSFKDHHNICPKRSHKHGSRGATRNTQSGTSSGSANICHDCGSFVPGSFKDHHKVCPNRRQKRGNSHIVGAPVMLTQTNLRSMADAVDFYGLIDTSGSMNGQKLASAKSAFEKIFVKLWDGDRIAIIHFDDQAYWDLQPRAVGQIRRQNEMPGILGKIYTGNLTALYDAIWMAIEQIRDKNKRTMLIVLTDGQDNASKHSYAEILQLLAQYPNISLNIVHVDDNGVVDPCYQNLCQNRGTYAVIQPSFIEVEVVRVFTERYSIPVH